MHNSIEKRLGEIALRVNDIETMATFYETVIQLPLLRKDPTMAFLRVSEGYQGHTSILALFKRDADVVQSKTSLDHIAFSIDLKDFEPQKKRLKDLGFEVGLDQHNWVQWKSMYIKDPEGNQVEFVCFDPSIPKNFES